MPNYTPHMMKFLDLLAGKILKMLGHKNFFVRQWKMFNAFGLNK